MDDTIDLAAMFLTPIVALREMRRCEDLAETFTRLAHDRSNRNPVGAEEMARLYQARAAKLRQIARPTAARIQSA